MPGEYDWNGLLSGMMIKLATLEPRHRDILLNKLPPPERCVVDELWRRWAHEGQNPDDSDWRIWMILAGRGYGKTRAGSEWVSALARADGALRFALVGATVEDVRKVMVEGESGLIAVAQTGETVDWNAGKGEVIFPSGAVAHVYSAESFEKLRGPEHHHAWCDELGKWNYAEKCWNNLMLGLRLGEKPRVLVTTTPRPMALLRRLVEEEGVVLCNGATRDNPNLTSTFVATVETLYAGTRFARQELGGELIEDVAGALWTRDLIEQCRVQQGTAGIMGTAYSLSPDCNDWGTAYSLSPACSEGGEGTRSSMSPNYLPGAGTRSSMSPNYLPGEGTRNSMSPDFFRRIVIGVDPPVSVHGDACGIVAVGLGADGKAYVLADHSVKGASPERWARAVAGAVEAWDADRVVAEDNQGGNMVESTLRAADLAMPVKRVHASRGKSARAEPVAALYEAGRAFHLGAFPELEDEMCGLIAGGGYEGPGRSPDRADALVWAMTELMLGKAKAGPRVSLL